MCRRGLDTTQNKGRNGFLSQPCGGPGGKTERKNEGRGMHEEAKASLNLAEKELICSKGEQKVSRAFNPPGPSIFPRRNVSIFGPSGAPFLISLLQWEHTHPPQETFSLLGFSLSEVNFPQVCRTPHLHLCASPRWEPLSPLPSVNQSH